VAAHDADRHWTWTLWKRVDPYGNVYWAMPLYVPFVLVGLPTCILFYRDRRSVRWAGTGRCVECGYDLAGNTTGACPECGQRREPDIISDDPSAPRS
jgi:hypothetical protein